MIDWLILIVGIFLLMASILDWKFKAVPSILLTGMLFLAAFLNSDNLFIGAMSFIAAFLLYESEFFTGIADLKVMTTLGFLIASPNSFLLFFMLTVTIGLFWTVIIKIRRKSKEEEVAFIPVFLLIYIILLLFGGIS